MWCFIFFKIHQMCMVYAHVSPNFVIAIYTLFPPIIFGQKVCQLHMSKCVRFLCQLNILISSSSKVWLITYNVYICGVLAKHSIMVRASIRLSRFCLSCFSTASSSSPVKQARENRNSPFLKVAREYGVEGKSKGAVSGYWRTTWHLPYPPAPPPPNPPLNQRQILRKILIGRQIIVSQLNLIQNAILGLSFKIFSQTFRKLAGCSDARLSSQRGSILGDFQLFFSFDCCPILYSLFFILPTGKIQNFYQLHLCRDLVKFQI